MVDSVHAILHTNFNASVISEGKYVLESLLLNPYGARFRFQMLQVRACLLASLAGL